MMVGSCFGPELCLKSRILSSNSRRFDRLDLNEEQVSDLLSVIRYVLFYETII